MGGNAFDSTRRLSEEEYQKICEKISEVLKRLEVNFRFPPEIADKAEIVKEVKGVDEPYGDVDILVGYKDNFEGSEIDKFRVRVSQEIADSVGSSTKFLRNNKTHNILSCENYQIDVLYCKDQELDFLTSVKANNDFLAFFGHLLSKFHLKITEKGLILNLKSKRNDKRKELVLCKNENEISKFFDIPDFAFDGKTRLSTYQAFEILVKSAVYFHKDEYGEKYQKREEKKGRPMIEKLFSFVSEYDGKFEQDKIPASKVRENFQEFLNSKIIEDEEKHFEHREIYYKFILEYFGKLDEGEIILENFEKKTEKSGSNFAKMLKLFNIDQKQGIEIFKKLRQEMGNSEFEKWLKVTSEEEFKTKIESKLKN